MLSYQHIYHAGNPADVHKHALLCWMLARMGAKPKPLTYLESHAGRGLYDLDAPEARRTGEADAGIGALLGGLAADHPYLRALAAVRAAHGARFYAGSPRLAVELARPGDAMHLAELHPGEFDALHDTMRGYGARLHRQDGLEMAMSLCPPQVRRGLMLIDPSWEVKTEYRSIPDALQKLHRKWNVGVLVLWYPLLRDARHRTMLAGLEAAGLPGAVRHEVTFPPVRAGHGMIGSGLFIVNAPFGLEEEAARIATLFA
ncbi:23S rRNA (adenine(2030)-N(6))-methyltransferase RlmJ [Pseudooceanicola aestuarii]|uniref:23S rRNA (adenine(2030)-N(6))-methyltransferase RlmJ n=1 Tax=Pseudooceanicola aestuarii TaxID=2697319 RepID=UPI0013D25C80|nr:23S rRNA (adenine(2030)-N(6))-methyltransferase RlmJ [Pseudooceanicola aestuarii]